VASKQASLRLSIATEGVRETLDAFKRLPKSANDALRKRSFELAEQLATKVAAAARSDTAQSALMAVTVKPVRDRVPAIQAGGTRRVGRHHVPAFGILLGSEFGSNNRSGWYAGRQYTQSQGRQYRPHRGRRSYWFFETAYQSQSEIMAAWEKAADDIQHEFTANPSGGPD